MHRLQLIDKKKKHIVVPKQMSRSRAFGTEEELSILSVIIQKFQAGEAVVYTKYGDGELECMEGSTHQNCDGDKYHGWLGEQLKSALLGLIKKPNTFIGKWWEPAVPEYCDRLAASIGKTVPWVCYHTIMNGEEFLEVDYMRHFAAAVVACSRKKILICNHLNRRMQEFFKANVIIEVPMNSWSYDYAAWFEKVLKEIEPHCVLLISAGLCSKVLINDITTTDPTVSCFDLGSAYDILARNCNSRCRGHSYEDEVIYYGALIPDQWTTPPQSGFKLG